MKEDYISLISADDNELDMFGDILKQNGIEYEIRDEPSNAFFSSYGAQSPVLGKSIYVHTSNLEKAKTLLSIDDIKVSAKRKLPIGIKIAAYICLAGIVLLIAFGILANFGIIR